MEVKMEIMFFKKNFFLQIIIIIGVILLVGFTKNSVQGERRIVCSLYPTGLDAESYLIIINDDGKMEVTFGCKENDNLIINSFAEIYDSKTVKISKKDCEELKVMVESILKIQEKTGFSKGGWYFALQFQKKLIGIDLGLSKESVVLNFINKLKKLSPIKIDLHSWS
jgi:hypothetical protein